MLITQAREGDKLRGFSFCTLERIGGTPCVLVGLASVDRTSKRDAVLKALMADQFRRAVLAFPDEDVLVGTRFVDAGGFEAFKSLEDIVPRPDHKATGEERAWGRRLAKRFGIDTYDDRAFIATGDGAYPACLDHETLKPETHRRRGRRALRRASTASGATRLIAFGWAMAEFLAKHSG